MRILIFIFFLSWVSCTQNSKTKTIISETKGLKPYQQYCLDILERVTDNAVGYEASDSFYLWSGGYVLDGWKPFHVTRTINKGFYVYLFWKKQKDSFVLYNELFIPKVAHDTATLADVNGDNYKDLVISQYTMNGQCQPKLANLFCFDITQGSFIEISEVSKLPNPKFMNTDKSITGEMECQMIKEIYKFRWTKNFKLDTVYYKTLKL